ncbi:MAG: glycosyltransferase family A protein [Steroidobacteraceae bacterium]|nr:glycosyltransferase family A protein [Steroidobacteraceae bacterium]
MILPTYDRAACLPHAIHSVLAQDFGPVEIIVVDDGSRDATREVVAAFGARVIYLYQPNRGVSAARNAGIARARGEWLAFLDSDDAWHPAYLSRQMAAAARFPDAVAHVTDSAIVAADGTRRRHLDDLRLTVDASSSAPVLLEAPVVALLGHSHWYLQATLARREAVVACGGLDERLRIAEDLELLALLAARGPVSIRREVLVDVHLRDSGAAHLSELSQADRAARSTGYATAYAAILERAALSQRERALVRRRLGQSHRAVGNAWLARGDARRAREQYGHALRADFTTTSLARWLATLLPASLAGRTVHAEREIGSRYARPGSAGTGA